MGYDGSLKFDTSIVTDGFNKGIKNIGTFAAKGMAVATTAISGLGAVSIKVGASFESEIGKVSAISGAVGDDLESLTEKAKEMGATTKFSASESAQAMEYMAMAGWKTEDMLNGIEGIMNLAAASGEDLATTSDIVTDALTAFGLSASDSGRFADVLAAASSNANTNVSMLGESFKYVAPVAGALGYSAEDAAVALGLMANSGIKAGQAGTSLRSLLTNMSKPTDDMQAAMDRLGISLTDSSGNMKSLDTIMSDLRDGFSGLSEAEKAQVAATLAGQEGMSGLLAIVNTSDKDFNKLKNSIYGCDGAAEQMAGTMQNNLEGKLTILKSSAEGLGIEIYDSIQGPLKDLAGQGIEAINSLTDAFKSGGTSGLVDAGAQIIGNLLSGLSGQIPTVVNIAITFVNALLSALLSNGEQFLNAGALILTEIGNGILNLLPTIGNFALAIATSLLQGFIDNAPTLLSAGADIILNLSQGISERLPDLVPLAIQAILTLAQSIVTNAPKILQAGINIVLALVQGIANSIPMLIAQAPKIINQFWSNFDKCVLKLVSAGVKVITTLAKGIVQSIPTIIANAGQIAKAILSTISHLNLLSAGKTIIKTLGSGLKGMSGNIVSIIKQIAKTIKTNFTKIKWGDVGKQIIEGIKAGIASAASGLFSSLKDLASNALNSAKSALGIHSPSKVFREQVGKQIVKGIVKGIKDLEGTLTKTASSVSLSAVASAKAAMNQGDLEEAGKSLISSLSDGVNAKSDATDKALQSAINQQIKNITDKKKYKKYKEQFSEVGKGLIESMSNALSESTTKITEQAQAKIEELSQSYQAAYDEVANKQSSLLSKMSDVSNMYDLDSQIEKISRYQDQLGKLKGRIPESLMDEILGMDVSEANNFTEYLNGLTNEQLSAYIGKWEQIQNTSKNYSDQFFKNELDTIKNSYSREVDNVMLDAKQQMEQTGINVAKGLISGLQSQTKNMSKTAKKIAKQLIKDFKTAFKIKSPSRVMQDEVGSFLPPGITKGFLKKLPDTEESIIEGISDIVKSVQRRISGLQYSAPAPAMLLAGTNQAPNITVVNSQPVQLNAEIHTDVDLDGRAVGKGVTTYVNQFMNDASNRERRGS